MSNLDKFTDYSATASSNGNVGGVNLAENSMLPSDVNGAFRELMSHCKNFAEGTDAINSIKIQDFEITEDSSGNLVVKASGTTILKLTTAGKLSVADDLVAFETL